MKGFTGLLNPFLKQNRDEDVPTYLKFLPEKVCGIPEVGVRGVGLPIELVQVLAVICSPNVNTDVNGLNWKKNEEEKSPYTYEMGSRMS